MTTTFTPKLGLPLTTNGSEPPTDDWGAAHRTAYQEVEDRLTLTFAGDPNGNVAGVYVGQECLDITNLLTYRCTTVGAIGVAVWSLLGVRASMIPDGEIPLAKLASLPPSVPIGVVLPFAGSAVPDSTWLLCFGQAVLRASYPTLFSVIGTTYGAGDGSTTFNLPDVRGRTIVGKDNMGGMSADRLTAARPEGIDGDTLGAVGGEEAHTQTQAELASHTHSQWDGRGDHANYVSNQFSAGTNPAGGATGSTGGGEPMNVVQPSIVQNMIIKAL